MTESTEPTLQEIIWQVVAGIPYGRVASYGQVAALAGYPRHARYVGSVLKQLPNGSSLPWYRVVNRRGEIAFPEGDPRYLRQQTLLADEGVILQGGRVPQHFFDWP